MKSSRIRALLPFISLVALFVYLGILNEMGDPRAADMTLEGTEMKWFEILWLIYTLLGIFYFWGRSIIRCHTLEQKGWLIALILVWPITPVYIWKEYENGA